MQNSKNVKAKFIQELDGIRGIAIIFVLIWHYGCCQLNYEHFGFWARYFTLATSWTWSGVDLFFVLSGFLIGGILLQNKESKNYFSTFYLRRILRIFPIYYLTILIFIIFGGLSLANKFQWLTLYSYPIYAYSLYIQNIYMSINGGLGANWFAATWSLAVEEQFYLILPLIIYFLNKKNIPYILVFGIFLAPIVRMYSTILGAYILFPARMDSLLFGVLVAYLYFNNHLKIIGIQLTRLKIITILFWLLLFYGIIKLHWNNTGGVLNHTLFAIGYSLLIILALAQDSSIYCSLLKNSTLTFLGRISYGIYLYHQIISGLLHQLIRNKSPEINNSYDFMITSFALVSTIALAIISYYFIEKPLISIGKKQNY